MDMGKWQEDHCSPLPIMQQNIFLTASGCQVGFQEPAVVDSAPALVDTMMKSYMQAAQHTAKIQLIRYCHQFSLINLASAM